jgi:nitrogen fixation protein FixH/xanthosine utilization system XapX-like protein
MTYSPLIRLHDFLFRDDESMPIILITLGVGLILILVGFTALYTLTRMQGKQVALIMFMAVMGIYVPYAILHWTSMDVFAIHIALFGVTPYILGIITSHWEIRRRMGEEDSGRWFHWAPAAMVIFFIVIATVDAIIITLSKDGMSESVLRVISPRDEAGREVSTAFPGTTSHDFQEKEALYNQYLVQLEKQKQRGWQVKRGFLTTPYVGEPVVFQVQVLDKAGLPVTGADLQGKFQRPSDKREDFEIQLQEVQPGLYREELKMPFPGRWYLVLHVRKGEDLHEIRGWTSIEQARGQN